MCIRREKKDPNIPFPVRNFEYQTNLTWIRIYTFTKKANDFLYETNSTIISYGLKEIFDGFFWLIFYYSLIKYILSKFSTRIEFSVTFYETISFAWLLQFATHQLKTVNRFTFGAKNEILFEFYMEFSANYACFWIIYVDWHTYAGKTWIFN